MEPTHLSVAEVDLLTMLMSMCHDGPLSDTGARLQRLIDRHTAKILCGAHFPFSGIQGTYNRPVGHDLGTHRWTKPDTGWQVFWDDPK